MGNNLRNGIMIFTYATYLIFIYLGVHLIVVSPLISNLISFREGGLKAPFALFEKPYPSLVPYVLN